MVSGFEFNTIETTCGVEKMLLFGQHTEVFTLKLVPVKLPS